MLSLLQDGLGCTSLNDYRLGQILEALFATNLNNVFGAVALKALEVYAIPTPRLHQDTTTMALYGAYERAEEPDTQRPHDQQLPGNKGETAAVVLSLFVPVAIVQVRLGNTDLRQVYGVQHSHLLVCDALGLDHTWYEAADSI